MLGLSKLLLGQGFLNFLRPLLSYAKKLVPPLMIPTKLKPYHIKKLNSSEQKNNNKILLIRRCDCFLKTENLIRNFKAYNAFQIGFTVKFVPVFCLCP